MKLTHTEADRYWAYALALKIQSKLLEFMILEKLPKKVNNPNLNNHVRRINQSADAIQKEAAYALISTNQDYGNDHAYALYRILNILMFADKDELYKIAESLEDQEKQVKAEAELKEQEVTL